MGVVVSYPPRSPHKRFLKFCVDRHISVTVDICTGHSFVMHTVNQNVAYRKAIEIEQQFLSEFGGGNPSVQWEIVGTIGDLCNIIFRFTL